MVIFPAHGQSGPGGVGNETGASGQPENVVWLRADRGTTETLEVTDWADQSGNANDAFALSLTGPERIGSTAGMNGRATLRFDRANDEMLDVGDTDDINTDPNDYAERTIALAFQTGSDVSTRQVLYEEGGEINGFNVYLESGSIVASAWSEDNAWAEHFSISEPVVANTAYVLTFVFDANGTNQLELFLDGTSVGTVSDPSITDVATHGGDIGVGNVNDGTQFDAPTPVEVSVTGGEGFDGELGELILYNTALNTAERQILESALSEKYAVAVANDRYALSAYADDVAGVGQTGGTSHEEASSTVLTFTNPTLVDGDFALAGHDRDGAAFESETDPTGIGERLSRVWRVDLAGTPDPDVAFDVSGFSLASGEDWRVLVDTGDPTFSSSASIVSGSLSGSTYTVSSADLNAAGFADGVYVTLAKTVGDVVAPAGLSYTPDPLTVANESAGTASADPSFTTTGQPTPTFTITEVRQGLSGSTSPITPPSEISLNGDGTVVVDPGTALQGRFEVDVEASNTASGGGSTSTTLVVEITEETTVAYPSQAVSINTDGSLPALSVDPLDNGINDATFDYTLSSGDLAGLSLNTSTGTLSGTPTRSGLIRAVVLATPTDGVATGTDSTEVNLAIVGGNGPAGIGDDESLIGDFDASTLGLADGTTVSDWTDNSAFGHDASGGNAVFAEAVTGLNGRPALDFSSATTGYTISDTPQFNSGGQPYAQRSLAIAFQTGSDVSGTTPEAVYGEGGSVRGISVYVRNSDLYVGMWNEDAADDETTPWGPYFFRAEDNTSDGGTGTVAIEPNTAYVVTFTYNYSESEVSAYVNGTLIGTQTTDVGRFFDHDNAGIGDAGNLDYDSGNEGNYDPFTGQIGAIAVYETALTDAQRQILEAGLGAKYGIAITGSRYDFAGTEEFSVGSEVVGVGRLADNPNPHAPTVASSILEAAPGGSFSDGDLALFGHDGNNATAFQGEGDVLDFDGSGADVGSRLERSWRVDLSGTTPLSFGDLLVDVSSLSLNNGQSYVLLADSDPTFSSSTTVVEGTVTGSTFTPTGTVHGSALSDGQYVTIARTVGTRSTPTNLAYTPAPITVGNGTADPVTATPSFDGGQPFPSFAITEIRDFGGAVVSPSEIAIDPNTGELTVDASTALQGVFEVDIEADNGEGTPATTTVTVRITEPVTLAYDPAAQSINAGEAIQTVSAAPLAINDATLSFAVVEGSLGSLSLNASTGAVTGTPTATGLTRAVIEVTGSDGATGMATAEVNVAVVGGDGPGGVGDRFADGPDAGTVILDLNAADLSAADGDAVSTWTDASNYGNDATGGTPTFRASVAGLNSRPALDFSTATSTFDFNSDQFNSAAPYVQRTLSVVFQTGASIPSGASSTPEGIVTEGGNTNGISIYLRNDDLYVGMWAQSNGWGPFFFSATTDDGATGEGTLAAIDPNTAYLVTLRYHALEGTIETYVNGTLIGRQDTGVGLFPGHNGVRIGGDGSYDYDGGNQGTYNRFTGEVAAVTAYDVALTDAQREIVESALAAEFGLSVAAPRYTFAGDAQFSLFNDVVGTGQVDGLAHLPPEQVSSLLTVTPSGATPADGDFTALGHNGDATALVRDTDVTDFRGDGSTTTDDDLDARIERTWRVDVTGGGTVDYADLTFDTSSLSLGTGQAFILLADTDPTFTASTTVVEGTLNGTEFTADGAVHGSALADGVYITLARTIGVPAAPSNLTYSPGTVVAEDGSGTPVTASASFDGGQPLPAFSIAEVRDSGGSPLSPVPGAFSIDPDTGVLTVDPSTSLQGTFEVDVDLTNTEGTVTETVPVRIVVPITAASFTTPVQTLTGTGAMENTAPSPTPDPSTINDAALTYTLQRVNAYGTIQSDLSGTGLSFDPATGTVSGTPSQDGTVAVTVEVAASGGANGTRTPSLLITRIGNTGIAGVGDAQATLLELQSDDLAGFADGSAVSAWSDASAYGNDATQSTAGSQPLFRTGVLNGQPVLRFDGSDDLLDLADDPSLNTGGPYLQRSLTIVFQTGSEVSSRQVIYEEGGSGRGYNLYLFDGDLYVAGWNAQDDDLVDPNNDAAPGSADPTTPWEGGTDDGFVFVNTPVTANTAYVATLVHNFATGTVELLLDGVSVGSATGAGRLYSHGGDIFIGANGDASFFETGGDGGSGEYFGGDVAALTFLDATANDVQTTLLHTALAAQYGIALDAAAPDVYAGASSANGDFDFGVLGVGRIDAATQHTSASRRGLTVTATSGLDDGDYLVLGSDRPAGGVTAADVTSAFGLEARLERIWYADVTGSGATHDVTFDVDDLGLRSDLSGVTASDFRLITRSTGSTTGDAWSDVGITPTINGTELTFSGVSITGDALYTLGTTNAADSDLQTNTILISGGSGNEGDAVAGVPGGDAGWRMLGTLVDGLRADAVTSDPDPQLIEFNLPANGGGNMLYFWDDDAAQPSGPDGGYTVGTASSLLTSGEGFFLYLFDDLGTSDADPIDPDLPITFPGTSPGGGDVTVSGLNANAQFHLLANPYIQPFDLSALDAMQSGDFQAVAQIWDAEAGSYLPDIAVDASTQGTDGIPTGGDRIAPGQAFWIERSSVGSGATAVTFAEAGISTGGRTVVGSKSAADSLDGAYIALRTEAFTAEGASIGVDLATGFRFDPQSGYGWDRYDATKFAPFRSPSVALAILGAGPDETVIPKSQESRSTVLRDTTVIPLALTVEGATAAQVAVQAAIWRDVPDGWEVALVDTRETATPDDDAFYPLLAGTEHILSLDGNAKADSTFRKRSVPALPVEPRLPDTPDLRLPAPAKSGGDTPSRFALRIVQENGAIPVEMAAFEATRDARDVRLTWSTATEFNNAGFHVEHRRVDAAASTGRDDAAATWTDLGFVKGAGTTDAPQRYAFDVADLDYGTHRFRLRQVDVDGRQTRIDPIDVKVTLDEAYVIGMPYPNPVRNRTTLEVAVRERQEVRIAMYDLLGRRVAVLRDAPMAANQTVKVPVNGQRLASGVYFLRVTGDAFAETRRVTVVR